MKDVFASISAGETPAISVVRKPRSFEDIRRLRKLHELAQVRLISQRFYSSLQFIGNCSRITVRIELHRLTEHDRNHAGWREVLFSTFKFVKTIQLHRHYRNVQLLCE